MGIPFIATKWVDFVMTDSTRRESCHVTKIAISHGGVNRWITENATKGPLIPLSK